ncbi:MAG TPA: hypothetical protein VJ927_11995 [Actinomycetota bacterium]|nr:hypothetical protein [Actinomycetota bacterium]
MNQAKAPIRELFVEELAEVKGGAGGPVEELLDRLGLSNTTQACCEEGNCGCDGPT